MKCSPQTFTQYIYINGCTVHNDMLSTENFVNYCTIHKIGIKYNIVDNNEVCYFCF